jgi:hypothetical protein
MTQHTQWVEHQGRRILLSNYAGLDESGYLRAMDETQRELLDQPAGSTVLTLTDVSRSHSSRAIIAKANELAAATREHGITTIDAVVGVGRLQRPIAQMVRREIHFADNVDAAKSWLVRQANK